MVEVSSADINLLHSEHADIRRETQSGFGETRYNIAERAGDIRREQQAGFGEIRYDIAKGNDVINDAVRVEGGNTRAQSALETNEIVKEGLKGDFATVGAIKDSRFEVITRLGEQSALLAKTITDSTGDVANRVELNADRADRSITALSSAVADRFFTVGRDLSDLRMGQVALGKDVELNALKTQLDSKQNTTYLSDKISLDGERTRQLINELKHSDQNRMLIERNAEIVEHRHYGHHWRGQYDQSQWQHLNQQLASQTANFNSQLSEARQGMVNFGTMAGVGQSSTNNNVR